MQFKHTILSNEDFSAKLGQLKAKASEVWALVTVAALDAVLKYHQHSYDTSRCQALDEALEEAKLGTHQAAFRKFLNTATGVMVGTWKNSASKLSNQPEPWEDIVARVEGQGLICLVQERKDKATTTPIRQEKAKTEVKVDSPAVRNAVQAMVDKLKTEGLSEEAQLERIRAAQDSKATGLFAILDPEVRSMAEDYIAKIATLSNAGRQGDAKKSLNAGIQAVSRHIASSLGKTVEELKQAAAA